MGRPPGDPPGGKGDDQRQRVGQVVHGVRDQRDRPRQDTAHDLRGRQDQVGRDGGGDLPVAPPLAPVAVVMTVVMALRMMIL